MERTGGENGEHAEPPSDEDEGLARPRSPEERRAFVKQATIVLFIAWLVAALMFLLFATPIRPE